MKKKAKKAEQETIVPPMDITIRLWHDAEPEVFANLAPWLVAQVLQRVVESIDRQEEAAMEAAMEEAREGARRKQP